MSVRRLTTEELIARKKDLDQLKGLPRKDIYLVLDNIRSSYNVGSIFRTADAARIKKMFLCGITPRPPRPDIEKTALQTIEYVPWEYVESAVKVVRQLKKEGIITAALEQTDRSIDYREFGYRQPLAIIIGNEVEGISSDVLELADVILEIPMAGIANSLNVATATGIILFKAIERD